MAAASVVGAIEEVGGVQMAVHSVYASPRELCRSQIRK